MNFSQFVKDNGGIISILLSLCAISAGIAQFLIMKNDIILMRNNIDEYKKKLESYDVKINDFSVRISSLQKGERGPIGPPGPAGPRGPQGEKGPTGNVIKIYESQGVKVVDECISMISAGSYLTGIVGVESVSALKSPQGERYGTNIMFSAKFGSSKYTLKCEKIRDSIPNISWEKHKENR